jgi:DHA2 family multidrug resistance protein
MWGYIALSLALIAGLLALANGNEKGWSSTYIVTCLVLATIGLVLFLGIESTVEHPLLDLGIFRYRNFSLSMMLAVFRAVGLFGGVFLLPIFLQTLVGYTTFQTGLWLMPGAVTVGLTMPFAGRLADRYGPRWLVTAGILLTASSLFIYGSLDPLSSAAMIIGPQIIRGLGLALMMAPLLSAAINAVPNEQVATASSFLNVAQTVGGSFGIAFLNSYVTNSIHDHGVWRGEHLAMQSSTFSHIVGRLSHTVLRGTHGIQLTDQLKGATFAARTIMQRASVMGFDNAFVVAGCILLVGTPLALWLAPAEHHVNRRNAARGKATEEEQSEPVGVEVG